MAGGCVWWLWGWCMYCVWREVRAPLRLCAFVWLHPSNHTRTPRITIPNHNPNDDSLPGVAVVRARADADGELRVDFHGLKVREAVHVCVCVCVDTNMNGDGQLQRVPWAMDRTHVRTRYYALLLTRFDNNNCNDRRRTPWPRSWRRRASALSGSSRAGGRTAGAFFRQSGRLMDGRGNAACL